MSKLRECGAKVQYRSRKEADAFAFMMKRKFLDSSKPYKCKHCKLWHLGHSRGLARRR